MLKKSIVLLSLILTILLFSSSIYSYQVERFSSYKATNTIIDSETIQVNKKFAIQNIHTVGIIPGQVEFKIVKDDNREINITNFIAIDHNGGRIPTYMRENQDHILLGIDIHTPILPGFEYKVDMNYTINTKFSGFLFKTLKLPLKEQTKTDIAAGTVEIILPDSKSYTYISYEDNLTKLEDNYLRYRIMGYSPEGVEIEYSSIPLRILDFKGSIVFWAVIDLILFAILIFEVRRRIKQKYEEE